MPGRRSLRRASLLLAAGAGLVAHAQAVGLAHDVSVENPRAFGHFVGDLLERRIDLTAPPGYALARDGLPKLDRATPWLELIQADARPSKGLGGTRYHIVLTYQVVNSPPQSRLIALPEIALGFVGSGPPFDEGFDEWPITLAPLAADVIRTGLEELRPSRVPRQIDAAAPARLLVAAAAVAAAALAWLAVQRFGRPVFGGERPFAAAHRRLRMLSRQPAGIERRRAMLRAVHRAFDEAAGMRVFGEHLTQFLAVRGEFTALREPAARFFAVSRAEFFGKPDAAELQAQDPDWLLELCARFSACERNPGRGGRDAL